MKDFAKMMISPQKTEQTIRNIKYFNDLQITAAHRWKFPCGLEHGQIVCHEGRFSLEMILNGEVDLLLDNRRIHLTGPCVFWIGDHNQSFEYKLIPNIEYEHLWIDFTGERGRRIYESLSEAYPESFIPVKEVKNILPVFEYFIQKFKIARQPTASAKDVVQIEMLMLELVHTTRLNLPPDQKDPYGILALAEQIQNAPFESYDPQILADHAGLSRVHFRALFRKMLGDSLYQYILKQQMKTAGDLLKSGRFRIGELSDYCGFQDFPTFSRAFKRYYRQSPKQWLAEQNLEPDPDRKQII